MIINCTPHPINLIPEEGLTQVFEPSGDVVRISQHEYGTSWIDGQEITLVGYGQLENMPKATSETYYIVSLVVALAVRRGDFLVPYEEVRNEEGTVIGCRKLAKVV